jgi:hypothetical protein
MPTSFAGCRRNVRLGRSVFVGNGFPPLLADAPATEGVLWRNEEGNVVGVRKAHALGREDAKKRALSLVEDTSFTRPRDPCTSVVTELDPFQEVEVAQKVRHRGRANL